MSAFRELLDEATLDPDYAYLRETPSGKAALWHKAFEFFCLGLFNLYCPLKVTGREHLPSPPYIVCSNHCSHMDSPALMYAADGGFSQFGMVAAKDYFFDHKKRSSLLPQLMNLIPAERRANRETIVRLMVACREFSRHGNRNIIIYPEGTRSQTGKLAPLKKGPAMIAHEIDMAIVPAYIDGTYRSYPKGGKILKPARVYVHFGEPILPASFDDVDTKLVYTAITQELTRRIEQLRDRHGHD